MLRLALSWARGQTVSSLKYFLISPDVQRPLLPHQVPHLNSTAHMGANV
jgi:hypothetical protein